MEDVALDRPLDPRVGGRTTRIHTNGHRGPAPPGARSRSEPTAVRLGIGLGRLSLHTAGPDNPDRATRPQLLGTEGPKPSARDPAGTGGVARANPGWNGWKAETAASRAGTGRDQNVALWESTVIAVTPYDPLGPHTV